MVYDFRDRHRLTVWPGTQAASLEHGPEGHLLRKTADIERLSAYVSIILPPETRSLALALTYRTTPGANLALTANFNREGGGNGSAGVKAVNFPDASEWTTREVVLTVPTGAASIQAVLGGRASSYEIGLASVSVTPIPDVVAVPRAPAGFTTEQPPSAWAGVAELRGFHLCVTADPASEQTDVRLTYDENRLYVGCVARLDDAAALCATVTDRGTDAAIFADDCLELFLSAPGRNLAWQFAVNPNGSRFDAEVRQNQAGDPWRVFGAWNGEWEVRTWRDASSWQAAFSIPWSTLGFAGLPTQPLGFNVGRENKGGNENSQWNAYDGNFHAVDRYASLDLQAGRVERTRRVDRQSYRIDRPRAQFEAVLGTEPGNYRTGTWGTAFLNIFPEAIRKLYTEEEERQWQETLLAARGEAGMMGPSLPWANSSIFGGWDRMREYTRRYGTRYPYVLFNSAITRGAIQSGARYHYGDTAVDPACEGYRQFVVKGLEELKSKYYYKDYLDTVGLVFGVDEPTNSVANIYSRSRNAALGEALDAAEAEIRASTGFGRFGLYDAFAEPSAQAPFERIAFWRWWNRNMARFCQDVQAKVHEVFPGVDFKSIDRNTVSGVCPTDVALLSPYSDWISCDPYPTSTAASYGRGRALYHPGFSAKMLGDLASRSRLCVTPQNFIYHGGRPEPEEMREWASQCMKVGAEMLYWYVEGAETLMSMWEGNLEALAINKQLKTLPRIRLPERTGTAILHSDYDRWGYDDNVLHPAYSLYVLLGEQNQAWFRFISPTGLSTGLHRLEDYRVVYVPRMTYTDPETTARLEAFVKGGGTLVSFDPGLFTANLDGSAVPERAAWFGTTLEPRTLRRPVLTYEGKELPLYRIANLPGPLAGKVQACSFGPLPGDARVLARYGDDDSPAIIERPLGQGRLILAAVQPFGASDVALAPSPWREFTGALCAASGEATGLPIWDFYLKKLPENDVRLDLLRKW